MWGMPASLLLKLIVTAAPAGTVIVLWSNAMLRATRLMVTAPAAVVVVVVVDVVVDVVVVVGVVAVVAVVVAVGVVVMVVVGLAEHDKTPSTASIKAAK